MNTARTFYLRLTAIALLISACTESPAPETEGAPVDRIVTLAPSVTEIAFALGLGDRVVGVGDYCKWPPEVSSRPRLGGLFNPNLEGIVALQPQLVILLPSEDELAGRLGNLGIEVLTVHNETLDDVEKSMISIAERCDVVAQGKNLVDAFRSKLTPSSTGGKPNEGATVLLSVGRPPGPPSELRIAGPGTFLDEIVTRLGARNAFEDLQIAYPLVSLEEVLSRKPDFIFELSAEELSPSQELALQQDWMMFSEVGIAGQQRVHIFDGDFTVVPGPRLALLFEAMETALTLPQQHSQPSPEPH